jgi:hypothetical protein
MTALQNLISELREKRLWPVAVALIVALIAVPVLLSSSSGPVALAPPPPVAGASASVPAVPAVSVTTTPSNARVTGPSRNPFTQQRKASAVGTSGSGSATTTKPATGAKRSTGSTASKGTTTSGGAGAGKTTASTTTTSTTTTPTATPNPTSTALTAKQSYHVTFAITNSAGGLDTIDPLERLSILPSTQLPLLVELGVVQGGDRVLFVVQPGTVVRGPGACIPGPIDCEILSLAPNQMEVLSKRFTTGVVPVAAFAVTAINTDQHSSAAAADKARQQASAAGRRMLSESTLNALTLFQYKDSLGAVVDLRNLAAGGN